MSTRAIQRCHLGCLALATVLFLYWAVGQIFANPLPPGVTLKVPGGCQIIAIGGDGKKEWQVKCGAIEFRTPDGKTRIQFMEDGATQITYDGLQFIRFGAGGGMRSNVRMEVGVPEKAAPEDVPEEPEDATAPEKPPAPVSPVKSAKLFDGKYHPEDIDGRYFYNGKQYKNYDEWYEAVGPIIPAGD